MSEAANTFSPGNSAVGSHTQQVSSVQAGDFWRDNSTHNASFSTDPLAFFRVLLQYKWPILLITLLVAALAVAYAMTVQPLYQSTQSLLLESTKSNVVAVEELIQEEPADEGYVQTQIERLTSTKQARRVINSLNLLSNHIFLEGLAKEIGVDAEVLHDVAAAATKTTHADEQPTLTNPSGDSAAISAANEPTDRITLEQLKSHAAHHLQSRLTVESVPTTRLVHITFLASDPELASNIANEFGVQYILGYVESNRSLVDEVSGWLGNRLAELKATLDASEQRLLDFKTEHGLIDFGGGVGKLGEQELLVGAQQLADARLQRSNLENLITKLDKETTTQGWLAHLPDLSNDPLIQQTRLEMNQRRQELRELSNQYGPRHPLVRNLQSKLDTLQSGLRQSLLQAIEAVRVEYAQLTQYMNSIERKLDSGKEAAQALDAKAVEFEALKTEVQTNRDLYYRFFSRMIETRSTQDLETVNATIVEHAKPAIVAAKPNKPFIISLATLGALVCSVLAAVVISTLDDSLKRLSDIEHTLGQRLLGLIPLHKRRKGLMRRLFPFGGVSQDQTGRMFVEAFKTLRTNLMLGYSADERKVILVTSSVPGEGKSMCSVCLARSFAEVERVLLIDADTRRPSLANALKFAEDGPGLTSVIAGQHDLFQSIQKHQQSGVDVLTSGPRTDQPLEMLSSEKFKDQLRKLGTVYDRIIIDCAPVEAVSDALLLSRLADCVIYVVKSHDTSIRIVSSGLEKLRSVQAPLVGLLLTQVDINRLAAYGADYEFHGYYDYYGYASPVSQTNLNLDRESLRRLHRRTA